jgi:hypothetical protein
MRFVDFRLNTAFSKMKCFLIWLPQTSGTITMKKINALSNKTSLGTYLTLALGAGAGVGAGGLGGHDAKAAIITSPVNKTSINNADPIFINFSNGVISSGQGISDALGTLIGFSGRPTGKTPPRLARINYDLVNDIPGTWSLVSLQPLSYGTTINASTQWGGERTDTSGFNNILVK